MGVQAKTSPTQSPQTRPAYTPNEVAEIIRLHPTYVRLLFTRNRIPGAVRVGSRWILPAPALDRILEQGLSLPSRRGAR